MYVRYSFHNSFRNNQFMGRLEYYKGTYNKSEYLELRRIWVSDPYGLTDKVQPVNPTWGMEGFNPFVLGGIASHHIATGTI
ncbi:hypothetical protein Golob_002314 [Gossypium lobatum]|uniref:Uncharacterized protein n=1 Tax=Gossypium lobatum TaxID=34289 RepID=A0A7J8N4W8_9ROSI|nr:hypothetical protein [Gossypium lobatum]